jgi:hypothetical protein
MKDRIDMALELELEYRAPSRNHTTSESESESSESLYPSLDTLDTNDPLFHACWRRQSCSYCLAGDVACSWCATVCDTNLDLNV